MSLNETDILYAKIKENVSKIKEDAARGCAKASQIITLHQTMVRCPEQACFGLLSAAFDDWRN